MTRYSISTHNFVGSGPTIVAHVGDEEIPALIFSKLDRHFPFDVNKMARNFCDLLNGLKPTESITSDGQKIYYEGHPVAVTLRYSEGSQT